MRTPVRRTGLLKCGRPAAGAFIMSALAAALPAAALTAAQPFGAPQVRIGRGTGYSVQFAGHGMIFGGTLPSPVRHVTRTNGKDSLGAYQLTTFQWTVDHTRLTGSIRAYTHRSCVLFSVKTAGRLPASAAVFPQLSRLPKMPLHMSYANHVFSPHTFSLAHTATPWISFSPAGRTWIMSPASKFMVSRMSGDGIKMAADALNSGIKRVPPGFTHRTILVAGQGIERTLDAWGRDLNGIQNVRRPGNQADVFLKYFGYWTDNGATYYYNYQKSLGYAGTLRKVYNYFRAHLVPLHYMQLDSWWYPKSDHYFNGSKLRPMNGRLPAQSWNVYGGIYRYHAAKELFPHGLAAFDRSIGGIPLGVHCRWIAHRSPYHAQYKISGVAAVDPRYWRHVAGYLRNSGVKLFEHDWLNDIYKESPQFGSTLWAGDAFTNSMAAAMAANGIDMQYCMPTARFFLQGSRYPNLTSIRVCDDHFMPARWNAELYTAAYARALGIWPWVDVFNSPQTGNMLLAVLSGGPVGVGDPIGKSSRRNILRAVLPDGLIVKPNRPMVVTDRTIVNDAAGRRLPLVARTFSDAGVRVHYLFVYRRKMDKAEFSFTAPRSAGAVSYIYNWFKRTGWLVPTGGTVDGRLKKGGWKYFVASPLLPCGIALLGDTSRFVGMGADRITSVHAGKRSVRLAIHVAPQETSVTVSGYARHRPRVTALKMCRVFSEKFNPRTGLFHIRLTRFFIPGIQRPGSPAAAGPAHFAHTRGAPQMKLTLAAD